LKSCIRYILGNGGDISLGVICDTMLGFCWNHFSRRITYESSLPLQAKVSAVIRNSHWKWPVARSRELVSTQASVCGVNFLIPQLQRMLYAQLPQLIALTLLPLGKLSETRMLMLTATDLCGSPLICQDWALILC